jgi:RimJ/RimL family protein N-acetyltransferase
MKPLSGKRREPPGDIFVTSLLNSGAVAVRGRCTGDAAPDAQGRGAGTALMRECIARSAGTRRIVLSTQPVARGSHRLYERLGFVREPRRDWAPVPGVDLLVYVLEL